MELATHALNVKFLILLAPNVFLDQTMQHVWLLQLRLFPVPQTKLKTLMGTVRHAIQDLDRI